MTGPLYTAPVVFEENIFVIDNIESIAYCFDVKNNKFEIIAKQGRDEASSCLKKGYLFKRSNILRVMRLRYALLSPYYLTISKTDS